MEEAASPEGKALLRGQNNRYKPLAYTMSGDVYIWFGTIIERKQLLNMSRPNTAAFGYQPESKAIFMFAVSA